MTYQCFCLYILTQACCSVFIWVSLLTSSSWCQNIVCTVCLSRCTFSCEFPWRTGLSKTFKTSYFHGRSVQNSTFSSDLPSLWLNILAHISVCWSITFIIDLFTFSKRNIDTFIKWRRQFLKNRSYEILMQAFCNQCFKFSFPFYLFSMS